MTPTFVQTSSYQRFEPPWLLRYNLPVFLGLGRRGGPVEASDDWPAGTLTQETRPIKLTRHMQTFEAVPVLHQELRDVGVGGVDGEDAAAAELPQRVAHRPHQRRHGGSPMCVCSGFLLLGLWDGVCLRCLFPSCDSELDLFLRFLQGAACLYGGECGRSPPKTSQLLRRFCCRLVSKI
jgi:hypothetical protein